MSRIDYSKLSNSFLPQKNITVTPIQIKTHKAYKDYKSSLAYGEFSQEYLWYKDLGEGTQRELYRLLDKDLPIEMKFEERQMQERDFNFMVKFILEILRLIRSYKLIGTFPVWQNNSEEETLVFVKPILGESIQGDFSIHGTKKSRRIQ